MKIAYLSFPFGGVDAYVATASRWLVAHGHDVHIIYVNRIPDSAAILPVTTHCVTVGNLHYYARRITPTRMGLAKLIYAYELSHAVSTLVRKLVQNGTIDLIELLEFEAVPSAFAGLPYVYKMHGSDWTFRRYCHDLPPLTMQPRLQRGMMMGARHVYSLSHSLADFIAEACNFPRESIHVTPYPIDLDQFQPATVELPDEPPYHLMTVGRLETRKGIHTLVEALQMVWETQPEVHLHLYGGDGNFGRAKIESIIPPSVHCGRLHFEGFVPREALIGAYQGAHIYVTPTRYETFGYTILEAMACGRPVIGTDIGAVPELVHHHETGWLIPRDDPKGLAQTILEALANPLLRDQYGRAAREFAGQFAIDSVMQRQVALYEAAIAARR